MKHAVFNSRQDGEDVQAADADLHGLPLKGTHAYPSGMRPDLVSPTPGRGWCERRYVLREHPTNPNRFAYPVADEDASALVTKIPAHAPAIGARAELTPDWDIDPPGNKPTGKVSQ